MKLVIEIDMDNVAFDPDPSTEVARILGCLIERILRFSPQMDLACNPRLRDINGNAVGSVKAVE